MERPGKKSGVFRSGPDQKWGAFWRHIHPPPGLWSEWDWADGQAALSLRLLHIFLLVLSCCGSVGHLLFQFNASHPKPWPGHIDIILRQLSWNDFYSSILFPNSSSKQLIEVEQLLTLLAQILFIIINKIWAINVDNCSAVILGYIIT